MDNTQEQEYRGLVRGAATYILLGQSDPPIDAVTIANLFTVELNQVSADINAIVQTEHAKSGGVFELISPPSL